MPSCVILNLMILGLSAVVLGAQSQRHPDDALLDVVVWGTHISIDPKAYSADLRAELEEHLRRATAYRSTRPIPASSELKMLHAAKVGYERRLVAVSADRDAPRLAAEYVDSFRPCYEWEGFHDCPEREAVFADEYHAERPNGPFSAYLPLLAAHRWLCTAEGYEYEKRPEGASRARQLYKERIAVALQSPVLLIRTAAEKLAARGRCFRSR